MTTRIDQLIAVDAIEAARSRGDDERRLIDVLMNEDSPWRNVRRGEFAVNQRALQKLLNWGPDRVRATLQSIKDAMA